MYRRDRRERSGTTSSGGRVVQRLDFEAVECQFAVAVERMKGLEIFLKDWIPFHEGQHLLEDVVHFVLNLIEDPLVVLPGGQNARVLQINEVSRRFRLREVEDALQVADAHFSVGEDEV